MSPDEPFRKARRGALTALAALAAGAMLPARAGAAPAKRRFDRGLLWRVSRGGVAPSYIFGTIHLADPRVLDLPQPVRDAFARCKRLLVESVQGRPEQARLFEAAQFEDGTRLEALIGADAFGKVAAHLHARGIPGEVIARLKPWAALANLTVTPEDYEGMNLDQDLVRLARERGMRVLGLEGIEEHISVFEGIPLDTQVALLKHGLESKDFLVSMIEPTLQAWLKRDLRGMRATAERVDARFPEVAAHYRILRQHVVRNRSVVMAHRLFLPLREGRHFIAVGADHLPGDDGVLALVQAQGWRLARGY